MQRSGRAETADLLRSVAGLDAPRTIKTYPRRREEIGAIIGRSGLGYPVLMRPAGMNNGASLVRMDSADELYLADVLALDGRAHYLTEFVDFRGADGLYRKHRFVLIGGRPYPRHVLASEHWNIHSHSRELMFHREDLRAEEADYLSRPVSEELQEICAAIHRALPLDYMILDAARTARGWLVFEVNACGRRIVDSQRSPAPFAYLDGAADRILGAFEQYLDERVIHGL